MRLRVGGVARQGVVLSWGNFSHYTEVLFRSHFLLLLIKIFHGRRRRAEVRILCRYKAQKSAPGRRQAKRPAPCQPRVEPPLAAQLTIDASPRQRTTETADCGCGLVTSSEAEPQHPMSARARPEHEPSTTAQPIALHNAKVLRRWEGTWMLAAAECGSAAISSAARPGTAAWPDDFSRDSR